MFCSHEVKEFLTFLIINTILNDVFADLIITQRKLSRIQLWNLIQLFDINCPIGLNE